jgi:hypothetical protein
MNCLLMRELPLELVIRVWDTYMSELETFGIFHVYACAAFLARFSEELRQLEFQDIMLFLKNPPTSSWTTKDIELLLSQACVITDSEFVFTPTLGTCGKHFLKIPPNI